MPRTPEHGSDRSVDSRVVRTRNDILRAALDVLLGQGREAVTHSHLARVAGYSRATVYKHWPTRTDLLRGAMTRLAAPPHHTPTGDLRADLIGELTSLRSAIGVHRFDRTLVVVVELAASTPELVEVRDRLVADGEHVVRQLLEPLLAGAELEAATMMLCGAVLQSTLLHGSPPTDTVIAATVDGTLRGFCQLS